jgi:hypothetical protein
LATLTIVFLQKIYYIFFFLISYPFGYFDHCRFAKNILYIFFFISYSFDGNSAESGGNLAEIGSNSAEIDDLTYKMRKKTIIYFSGALVEMRIWTQKWWLVFCMFAVWLL